ncbi:MAG TPA: glucosidase [Chloroflexia bacterium]|nr:glucosidase [Chloroflexia bacterium]
MNAEQERLRQVEEGKGRWDLFGPYLSERAWATVREDYSPYGTAWDYFPHDHARSRVYRWNEDGLAGISDDQQRLCFALALWNGKDAILKERMFGLTGQEGNHGEDVKEYYYYLDSTPTHSYMKMLYKYPQAAFPYAQLVEENRRRGKQDPEFELVDMGIFDENRYFDVFVEYAKTAPEDMLIRIKIANRGPEAATLHLLPTLWFRNTWAWGRDERRPEMSVNTGEQPAIQARHHSLGTYNLYCEGPDELLFTENETNNERLFGVPSTTPYLKDAFHEYVINGRQAAVNPARTGTKAAVLYKVTVPVGQEVTIRLRLSAAETGFTGLRLDDESRGQVLSPFADFNEIFSRRLQEADRFYNDVQPVSMNDDLRLVQRQAFAGMLWSKQFYYYDVDQWINGDPAQPAPPPERRRGRNWEWRHLNNADVISMPDKWEYPWYAAWDLAFHCIPLALVDSHFAKKQLDLLTREWYQHPNGAIPAYEWAFSDVNPPVFAWSAWRVYKIEEKQRGKGDTYFLETIFHKLMLNFNWWVNRKDSEGMNVFQGGFLGLDNIGVFDRSAPLPTGGHIEQSDGTSWMGMFSLNMLKIALELARTNRAYENIATKFFEHFLAIAAAMSNLGDEGVNLWDEQDSFFYDVLHLPNGEHIPVRLRSLVGLIPLLAVETIEPDILDALPAFKERLEWYLNYRPELARLVSRWYEPGAGERRLLALVRGHRMKSLLRRMLDEQEFLSQHGIRAISKVYEAQPYVLEYNGLYASVQYEPGESRSGLFGGNSNWRGPVWFPINYLLVEALQKFYHYYGDDFKVECPVGSGQFLTLWEVAGELSNRLITIFTRDENGRRPFNYATERFQQDPFWRDLILFNEYFHGDTAAGVGASHQTGWTGIVAKLIQQQGSQQNAQPAATPAVVEVGAGN